MVAQTMVRQLNAAREHVDLISALTHEAPQTLASVGGSDGAVHRLRKLVKGQRLVFFLNQAVHGLGRELAIPGFEGGQLRQGPLFGGLGPDAQQFGLDVMAYASGDSTEHVGLLVQATALSGRRPKQCLHCCQDPLMAIGHQEIQLGRSARSQVCEHTHPAVFALLSAGPQCSHLCVAGHIHTQGCEDTRRISLIPLPYAERDPIQVQDAPVLVQPTLAKGP
jgi:hypothetical protein